MSLFDEFNGIRQPRVSFFQEDLSANRTSIPSSMPPVSAGSAPNYSTPPGALAYTVLPMTGFIPSFAYYNGSLTNDTYNNGITFQANTVWTNPFSNEFGSKLTKNINGSPNGALEGAFNSFLSEYLEVYPDDMNEALPPGVGAQPQLNAQLWAGQLQSWHDYSKHLREDLTPLESPAGLTVERSSATNNVVKWDAVFGATTYQLQRNDLSTPSAPWTAVTCSDPTATKCTDTASTGASYAYRVQGSNGAGSIMTPWANVAVFLSEALNDGYVQPNEGMMTVYKMAAEPGIHAGRGPASSVELRGFLSFATSPLGGATVIDAKLRLYQASNNDGYTALKPSQIDIIKGAFNGNLALEGPDFNATPSQSEVAQVEPLDLSSQTPPDWVESEINPLYLGLVNNSTSLMGHTQFRLRFLGTTGGKQVQWNSGNATTNVPYLIVRYQ